MAWPRTVLPIEASWPVFPTGLVSMGASRKTQLRSTTQVGREWEETYGPLHRSDARVAAFLAEVNNYWRNLTVFDIDHRALRAIRGSAAGAPAISVADQTGSTINVSGFTPSAANVLRAGDVIRFPGLTLVYDVTADVSANGAGVAAVPINPPIFVGGSPAVGPLVTNLVAGSVLFRARIARLDMPRAGANEFYAGLTVAFQEQP